MHSPNLISSVVLLVMFLTNVATRAAEPKSITLFNGKDLTGWTPYLWNPRERKQDTDTLPSKVWQVRNSALVCKGRPTGYLRTNGELVNHVTECSETRGAIALQSEGAEINFRNIFLTAQRE